MAKKALNKPKTGLIAALDIGSSKICCFVARVDASASPGDRAPLGGGMTGPLLQVTGIGHQVSRGVKGGTIVDMEQAVGSIRDAITSAERMAHTRIDKVLLNLSGGYPISQTVGVDVSVAGHEIGDGDLRRVLGQGRQIAFDDGRELVHSIPVGFTIDDHRGIQDPRGMTGDRLGAQMHVVTAASSTVRNLTSVAQRAHLTVEGFVVSPFASGLACLVEDEIDLGVTLIDMGGGTTTIAVFYGGSVIYTDCIPVGGQHITSDIARGLSTPMAEAERLKTFHGNALAWPLDDRETLDIPLIGEDPHTNHNQIPKSLLGRIIRPRLEETFEMVQERLEASGMAKIAGQRVVLTGGASQLTGAVDLAQKIMDRQARLGRPIRIQGLADATAGPAFSTCAGLVAYAVDPVLDASRAGIAAQKEPSSLFGKVGSWLRESF